MAEKVDIEYAKSIINRINESFIEVVGPVASVLCDETLREWSLELQAKGIPKTLKTISLYIDKLAIHIEDMSARDKFVQTANYGVLGTSEVKDGNYAKIIFNGIDECFADEVGPVAEILCKEALIEWNRELKAKGIRRSLKVVPLYIDKLAEHIIDPEDTSRFMAAVYAIEALQYYKK